MNVIEKKRTDRRGARPKVSKVASAATEPKTAALSPAVDGQLREVERTFTDRWEW